MRRPAFLVLLPFVASLLLGACGGTQYASTLDRVRDRGELVVGTEPEFPPFETKNEKGEFVGFDMDLAREIAKELGVQLRIEAMSFDSLPTALATNRIDLILSGMTATPKRAESRAFSNTYFETGLCLLVHRDSGIETPDDVGSKRLVVKLGTTGDINAGRLFPQAKVTRLDAEGTCAMEVATGRADAFLYDQHSVERHHRENPTTTRALLDPLTHEPYAMAVRLGDDAFVEWLNGFLERFRADGRYAAIYEKHFGHPPSR